MPTGKKPAQKAGKLLGKKNTPEQVKEVAGSALSQAKKPEAKKPKKKKQH